MNQEFGKAAFDQAESFFKGAGLQAVAEKSVAASKEMYDKASAIGRESTKAFTEIADAAWGSTKMLNEHLIQTFSRNMDAAFAAAREIAGAKSLPEIATLQSEYVQRVAAQTMEQGKEFGDLSTRATQHLFERLQAATTALQRNV
jgi:phasin family protein